MVIVNEKSMQQPPPPYANTVAPPPFSTTHQPLTLPSLPSHILLQIVYSTFPQTPALDEGRLERQRKTLYWLEVGLRLVNRAFYIGRSLPSSVVTLVLTLAHKACMHVLRSTYLPAYDSLIRKPYTSDPFPLSSPTISPSYPTPSPIQTIQRETTVLDLFIALKVREDVWMDDSELHLERDESFKDLFDLSQPRSRVEDLVRYYGQREGVVTVASEPYTYAQDASSSTPTPASPSTRNSTKSTRPSPSHAPQPIPIPFSSLSISFSSRKVGLVLSTPGQGRKRTIVEVPRTRDEKLEVAAKRVVRELRGWLQSGG